MTREKEVRIGMHPPFTWFTGICLPNEGIKGVFISKEFMDIANHKVRDHMYAWWDTNNSQGNFSELELKIRKASEEVIETETGFKIQEIEEFRRDLNERYFGKTEAPFHLEWIR